MSIKLPKPELVISMFKSKLMTDGILNEAEVSELKFTMVDGRMKVEGPQHLLDKMPR